MGKCKRCFVREADKVGSTEANLELCGVCKKELTENFYERGVETAPKTIFIKPVVNVYLKQGNKIIFADADDYFIDNNNGWLTIYKDGKRRATLSLSKVDSVFVE